MDPKPVKVTYADGSEGLGIMVDRATVDVGEAGLAVHVDDQVAVDGRLWTVIGRRAWVQAEFSLEDASASEESSVRLMLAPLPREENPLEAGEGWV